MKAIQVVNKHLTWFAIGIAHVEVENAQADAAAAAIGKVSLARAIRHAFRCPDRIPDDGGIDFADAIYSAHMNIDHLQKMRGERTIARFQNVVNFLRCDPLFFTGG